MFDHATRNANSPIGYNLAFIRNTYEFIIIEHTLVDCLNLPRPKRLNQYQCALIIYYLRQMVCIECIILQNQIWKI